MLKTSNPTKGPMENFEQKYIFTEPINFNRIKK